jgi:hypothetical protein
MLLQHIAFMLKNFECYLNLLLAEKLTDNDRKDSYKQSSYTSGSDRPTIQLVKPESGTRIAHGKVQYLLHEFVILL